MEDYTNSAIPENLYKKFETKLRGDIYNELGDPLDLTDDQEDYIEFFVNFARDSYKAAESTGELMIIDSIPLVIIKNPYTDDKYPIQLDPIAKSVLNVLINKNLFSLSFYNSADISILQLLSQDQLNKDSLKDIFKNSPEEDIIKSQFAAHYISRYIPEKIFSIKPELLGWFNKLNYGRNFSSELVRGILSKIEVKISSISNEHVRNIERFRNYLDYSNSDNTFLNSWLIASLGVKRFILNEDKDKQAVFGLRLFNSINEYLSQTPKQEINPEIIIKLSQDALEHLKSLDIVENENLQVSIGLELECVYNGIWVTGEVTKDEVLEYIYLKDKAGRSKFAADRREEIRPKLEKAQKQILTHEVFLDILGIEMDMDQNNLKIHTHEYVLPPSNNNKFIESILKDLKQLGYMDLDPENLNSFKRTIDINIGSDISLDSSIFWEEMQKIQIAMILAGKGSTGILGVGAREILDDPSIKDVIKNQKFHPKLMHLLGGKDFVWENEKPSFFDYTILLKVGELKGLEITSYENLVGIIENITTLTDVLVSVAKQEDYPYVRSAKKFIKKIDYTIVDKEKRKAHSWFYFDTRLQEILEKYSLPGAKDIYDYISYPAKHPNLGEVAVNVGYTNLEQRVHRAKNATQENFENGFMIEINRVLEEIKGYIS